MYFNICLFTDIDTSIIFLLHYRYLPIKPCMDLTKFGQGYNWKCSNEEIVKGTQCRLNCWKRKYGVHNTTVECKGDKWKVICLIMIF